MLKPISAYNGDTIVKVTLHDWKILEKIHYTDQIEWIGGFRNRKKVRKLGDGLGFYCYHCDVPHATWDVEFLAHTPEELEAISDIYKAVKLANGGYRVERKPYVEMEFINGEIRWEQFESFDEAKKFYCNVLRMVPNAFEFDAFIKSDLKESQES